MSENPSIPGLFVQLSVQSIMGATDTRRAPEMLELPVEAADLRL